MTYLLWELNPEWAKGGAPAGVVQPGEFGTAHKWAQVSGHPYQYNEGGMVGAFGTYAFGGLPMSAVDPKMPLEARFFAGALKIPLWGGYLVSIGSGTIVLGGILTLLDPLDLYRGGIIPDKYARETIRPVWEQFQQDIKSKPPPSIAKQLDVFMPV